MLKVNRDVKSAADEDSPVAELLAPLHRPGAGPFAINGARIKRRYVVDAPRSVNAGWSGVAPA